MPTLEEIRQEHPDYEDVSDEALAEAIHQKSYSDVPFEEFRQVLGLSAPPAPIPDPVTLPEENPWKVAKDRAIALAQGATASTWDELSAGLSSELADLVGKDVSYEALLAENRARYEEIPLSARIPGEIVGGVGAAMVAGPAAAAAAPVKLARALSTLPGWIRATGLGGIYGAAYGAGGAEEGKRVGGAKGGAMAGAALSAAGYPIVKGGTILGQKLWEGARKRWGNSAATARAKVAEALIRDEMTRQRLQQRLKDLGEQGIIADAGGKNIQGLARHTASVPGPAQNRATILLNQRAEGESARVARAIDQGLDPQDYYAAQGAFLANMRTKAGPAYQKAYEQFPEVTSPPLKRILNGETGKKALKEAITLNRMDREAGMEVVDLEAAVKSGKLSLEAWDDVKRGFDSILDSKTYRNELTAKLNKKGWKVDTLRKVLLKELDEATGGKAGDYAKARAVYAGEAEALGALRDGRKALNWDPERITSTMDGLSESGKEAFRSGVARALKDAVHKTVDKGSAARRIFGTVFKRKQIRAAFPDAKSFRELGKALIAEQRFAQTRNYAISGSSTTPRAAESADALTEVGGIGGVVAGTKIGKILGAHTIMTAGIGRRLGAALLGKTKAHDLEVAKLLFRRDPEANRRTIDVLFTESVWNSLSPALKKTIGQAMLISASQQGAKALEAAEDFLED